MVFITSFIKYSLIRSAFFGFRELGQSRITWTVMFVTFGHARFTIPRTGHTCIYHIHSQKLYCGQAYIEI